MYDAKQLSRVIINYSHDKQYDISNLRLQKLLYFIQAAFILFTDEPAFKNKIEAWRFGPVVPDVYYTYNQNGNNQIPRVDSYIELDPTNPWGIKTIQFDSSFICDKDYDLLTQIIDYYSKYDSLKLVDITHKQDPWNDVYIPYKNSEITIDSIKKYFKPES